MASIPQPIPGGDLYSDDTRGDKILPTSSDGRSPSSQGGQKQPSSKEASQNESEYHHQQELEKQKMSKEAESEAFPKPSIGIVRSVTPPLFNVRLGKFIYVFCFLLAALTGLYTLKNLNMHKNQAGGWLNLLTGHKIPQVHVPGGLGPDIGQQRAAHGHPPRDQERGFFHRHNRAAVRGPVEEKIFELARVLGMPSNELASAIAIAVREYVPPASLSSIAAEQTGRIVEALIIGKSEYIIDPNSIKVKRDGPTQTGVIDSLVGMEEP